jgi:ABC-type phosphate transport system substrate-binding protein
MKRFYDIQGQLQTVALVAIAFIYGSVTANAQKVRIGVKDASFTKGLIETLASEYNKENRGVEVEVVSSADADAKVQLAANGIASVGKFVVLPIANSENEILTNKKLRKGVNDKVEKEIFVQPTYEEVLDAEEEGEKALPGMVYSLSGSKAYITQIFAEALHTTPSQLKGKKILGREENVLSVVKQQHDAISFNVSSLIYDLSNRQPQQGISVLSVDLDGNGKVTEDERAALANIDALNEYVGKLPKPHAPIADVVIVSDNQGVKDFVAWVQAYGQEIVASQGFIRVDTKFTAQR